ncbi:hypothetical protein V8D89_015139 [Ganoderma adspersum]
MSPPDVLRHDFEDHGANKYVFARDPKLATRALPHLFSHPALTRLDFNAYNNTPAERTQGLSTTPPPPPCLTLPKGAPPHLVRARGDFYPGAAWSDTAIVDAMHIPVLAIGVVNKKIVHARGPLTDVGGNQLSTLVTKDGGHLRSFGSSLLRTW